MYSAIRQRVDMCAIAVRVVCHCCRLIVRSEVTPATKCVRCWLMQPTVRCCDLGKWWFMLLAETAPCDTATCRGFVGTGRWYWWWYCRRHCQRWRCQATFEDFCTAVYEEMTITIHSKCWHSARLLQLMVALLSNLVQDEAGDGASNRSGLIRQLSILSSCLGQRFFFEWRYRRCTLETKGIVRKLINAMQKYSRIGPKKDRGKHCGEDHRSLARMVTAPKKKSNRSFKNVNDLRLNVLLWFG